MEKPSKDSVIINVCIIPKADVGKKYLRERKTIEAEYNARKKKLLEIKEPETFAEPAEN